VKVSLKKLSRIGGSTTIAEKAQSSQTTFEVSCYLPLHVQLENTKTTPLTPFLTFLSQSQAVHRQHCNSALRASLKLSKLMTIDDPNVKNHAYVQNKCPSVNGLRYWFFSWNDFPIPRFGEASCQRTWIFPLTDLTCQNFNGQLARVQSLMNYEVYRIIWAI